MSQTPETTTGAHRGPPLVLLAIIHGALVVATLALLNGAADGGMPLPGAPAEGIDRFVVANAGPLLGGLAITRLLHGLVAKPLGRAAVVVFAVAKLSMPSLAVTSVRSAGPHSP